MKTCPACHRAVPDDAATCPHPACGHRFAASHTSVKRPPPPPTKVHVTGDDARAAGSPTADKQPSTGELKPWRWPLVLLAAILLTSGLTASLTAFWLRGGQNQKVAAAKGIAPQTEPKAAAKAAEPAAQQPPAIGAEATTRQGGKAKGRQGDGESRAAEHDGAAKQDGVLSPPNVDEAPKKPSDNDAQQPLGPAGDARKTPMPEPLTGVVDEPKPELPGGANEPELPVVADTPEGLYAARTKPKTAEFLGERGGTLESQKAVDVGLNWLARHQGLDGHWGADCLGTDPNSRCEKNDACQGPGMHYEIAHTGLALLAFQAAGQYDFNGQKYSGQVAKGLDYLIQRQAPDGYIDNSQVSKLFVDDENTQTAQEKAAEAALPAEVKQKLAGPRPGFSMYEHAIGTFALCEACAVALAEGKKANPRYQEAAARAVYFIENIQHNDGGWRYTVGAFEPSDCSVSGWMMLALKTARVAKLDIQPQTIPRMMSFFASHYADGQTYYQRPVEERLGGGTITILSNPWMLTDATTGVGMMAVEFFEHKLDSPIVQGGAAYLADKADALAPPPPGAVGTELRFRGFNAHRKVIFDSQQIPASTDYYLWYNCTMAMFQAGGEPWKRWNGAMRDRLIALQVPGEGCDRGSWIPQGDAYGDWGGRIYTTALALLTLEVYYRFQRVADEPTGPLADAPGKPLDVPEEPKLDVVADTPEGLYGARTKPKTADWLAERGGTVESQKAVEEGLDWLSRHQGEEGHWGADCLGSTDPNSRCDRNAPCQDPGLPYEIAHTGFALLAFQAAGHYYFNGQKYSGQVAKGLDYFVQEQAPDGSIVGSQNPSPELMRAGALFQRNFMYEHAIGTLALCEACAVALAEGQKPDPRYQRAAQRAVSFIEREQHRDGGWRYGGERRALDEKSDCSVSGWVMLALKAAGEAKVHASPQTISLMMDFFAAHNVHGRTIYQLPSTPGGDAIIGMGMMAVEFFEHKLDSPIVQNGAAYLASEADVIRDRPAISGYYSWCNGTMAMFQVGGEPWKRWNGVIRDHLVSLQVRGEGCDRGSWPPNDVWGLQGGRIYSTALAVQTLEVYYRFQRIAGQPEKEKSFEK